jgi:UDPglucose 6-dehydrogenase
MSDIAIVGCGFVGKSLLKLFGECEIYDPSQNKIDKKTINRCQFAFVCVPTPVGSNGSCDVSIVEEVVSWIESEIIIIRSTVSPGTTDKLRKETGKRIIFQPEYIGETVDHPLIDHHSHGFAILGGPIEDTSIVADLYKRFFNANFHFYFTSAVCAEVAKYMENCFYATKVTFCNEFYDIAKTFGVDYNELREIWLADPRISRDHTFVYPDKRGFAGKCLPKDLSAIIVASETKGFMPEFLKKVKEINNKHQK